MNNHAYTYNHSDHSDPVNVFLGLFLFSLSITTLGLIYCLQPIHVGAEPATASVNVGAACTVTATNTNHTATLTPGSFTGDIGLTNVTATCNDPNGYAFYAIGYTNDEYGNTNLIHTTDSTKTITTNTNTSGATSGWSMKLASGTGDSAIIQGQTAGDPEDFTTYHVVPTTYTKVAEKRSATNPTITGTSFTTTYGVYPSPTQTAGNYTGQVKYTLVHPYTAPTPEIPWTPQPEEATPKCISYWPNGRNVNDSMADDCNRGPFGSGYGNNVFADLWAPNFQNPGYGFAGWTDKYDWVLNQNDANGNGTGQNQGYHIYGPNATITTPSDMTTNGLSLYAVWVPSAGDLQSWTGCSAMSTGQVTALTDTRDNNTYAVARLADGNCWMIENLRLDNQYTTSEEDIAKAQGYNSSFIGLANPENTLNWTNSTTANSLYSINGSTSAPAITGSNQTWRFPRYNNQNTNSPIANMTKWERQSLDNAQNIYSVGNWYTWASVVADTNDYTTNNQTIANTSICPSGWHLPSGGNSSNAANSDFWKLGLGIMGFAPSNSSYYQDSETNAQGKTGTQAYRSYPNNFIYSGVFTSGSPDRRGSDGYYWSSTVYGSSYSNITSYILHIKDNSRAYPGTTHTGRSSGETIRCLAQ